MNSDGNVGHFRAEEWNAEANEYTLDNNMGLKITVDVRSPIPLSPFPQCFIDVADVEETFDNDHRVISQKSGSTGRFTFTAAESGEHRLCFQTSGTGGWFSSSHVKL